MNAEKYVKELKEQKYTPKKWAKERVDEHIQLWLDKEIEFPNKDFYLELCDCKNWKDVYNIVNNYII